MPKFKKISIVVPVYNEEKTLDKIIAAVEKADVFGLEKEIILVNDCSRDKSKEILEKYKEKHKIFHHKKNQGKGAALKIAIKIYIFSRRLPASLREALRTGPRKKIPGTPIWPKTSRMILSS